jgi:hypothetical protein
MSSYLYYYSIRILSHLKINDTYQIICSFLCFLISNLLNIGFYKTLDEVSFHLKTGGWDWVCAVQGDRFVNLPGFGLEFLAW